MEVYFSEIKLLNVTNHLGQKYMLAKVAERPRKYATFTWLFSETLCEHTFVATYKISGALKSVSKSVNQNDQKQHQEENKIKWRVIESGADFQNTTVHNITCHVYLPHVLTQVTTFPANANIVPLAATPSGMRIEFQPVTVIDLANNDILGANNGFEIVVSFPEIYKCDKIPNWMIWVYASVVLAACALFLATVIYIIKCTRDMASVKPESIIKNIPKPAVFYYKSLYEEDNIIEQDVQSRWNVNNNLETNIQEGSPSTRYQGGSLFRSVSRYDSSSSPYGGDSGAGSSSNSNRTSIKLHL